MLKYLLVVTVIAAVYFFFIKKKPAVSKKQEDESSEMVECSTCQTYCEISETIISNGKYYCSKECLEKVN